VGGAIREMRMALLVRSSHDVGLLVLHGHQQPGQSSLICEKYPQSAIRKVVSLPICHCSLQSSMLFNADFRRFQSAN